jgi:hypothetical protein
MRDHIKIKASDSTWLLDRSPNSLFLTIRVRIQCGCTSKHSAEHFQGHKLQRTPGAAGIGGGEAIAVGGGDGCIGGVDGENRNQVLGGGGIDSLPMFAVDGAQDRASVSHDPARRGGGRCARSQSGGDAAALLLP